MIFEGENLTMRSSGTGSVHEPAPTRRDTHCPGLGELSAFSRGALPLAALHSIAQHVSVCAVCDSKVSTLVSDLEHKLTAVDQGAPPTAAPSLDSGPIGLEGAHVDASGDHPFDAAAEAPTAPLRLGQYRLVRQIGHGGMGVVYQARHERLLRDVAIKFVPIETVQDILDAERLQREMAAAGTMRHPNVVYATDAGEAEGIQYLVMEYVEGIDLSKLVARIGPLPIADACEIIRQAAEGLAHVEQQKLVHRDLKPSNLMLAADGIVKILDLGLARVHSDLAPTDELTRNGYLLGTIDYVAPEQARDAHAADIRSDLYSLGCTCFKLLTGGPPFGSQGHKSVASKILAHEHSPPPPLADFRPDVPPEVEAVVRRMLAKEPAERFQSPTDLKRALKAPADGAHLPALLALARVAPPSMPRSAISTASKPSTIGEMPTEKRSTIAGPRTRRTRVAAGIGGGVVVCLAAMLLWLSGWLPGLPGLGGRGAKARPSPAVADILAAPNSGQIDYPFSPDPQIGIRGQVTEPQPGELKLESEFIQLVRLGYLRDDAQRVSLSIDQPGEPRWSTGLIGIFLGYHEYRTEVANPKGEKQIDSIGEFQLLILHRLRGGSPRENYLVAERKRAYIHPTWNPGVPHAYFESFVRSERKIPLPTAGESLPVVIEFSGRGDRRQIKRIAINGVELDDLADPLTEVQFLPRDYEGTMGLYNEGNLGGAVFSNFDLSDLEKE